MLCDDLGHSPAAPHPGRTVSDFLGLLGLTLFMASGLSYAAETPDSRLVEAARNQDQKAVRALLTQKVDVNARSSDGSTALLWLAHWNDLDTANLLLGAGADANARE